jgi:fructose-bisphosphate aldolase class I
MNKLNLESVAKSLVTEGKGILAADESFPTIEKRLRAIGVASTEQTRRTYREILFATAGLEKFVSGVILFDETIRQTSNGGMPLRELLTKKGIVTGIKVDKGLKPLAGFVGEKITEGLDGLVDRLCEYRELGAKFAKWRAVITIGENIPTTVGIESNAHLLARYAAIAQEAGLVPIVEPEVLMDGNHTIEICETVTETTLNAVFSQLVQHRVLLEGIILKPNMVLAGKGCPNQANVAEVAEATLRCMRRGVPAAVPGICFLSGGQSADLATEHLNAMNAIGGQPWQLSFSYGRALQQPAMQAWKGDPVNIGAAQQALLQQTQWNSQARYGHYQKES